MLTYTQLVALHRSLRDERVLSVYLHGAADDPAARLVWRRELDRSLKDLRHWLAGSPHEEREGFERCVTLLEERLAPFAAGLAAPGWVAFITADTVHLAEGLPVPMPTRAIWSTGVCAAPYIRALEVTRPVIVAVVDARAARIYRYHRGELAPLESFHAHATIDAPAHMGDAPRTGFHPGVRGGTAHDAVQRAHAAGTARMLRQVEGAILRSAGLDGWVLVGGIPGVSARVARALAATMPERTLQLQSLDVNASDAEIAGAAQTGASALRDARHVRGITEIVGQPNEGGLVAIGPAAARTALEQASVRELYLTPRYIEDHPADAEGAVRQALDQGAVVEEAGREAAALLDQHGGLAARLRYRLAGPSGIPGPANRDALTYADTM
jgi:hypothetical protein